MSVSRLFGIGLAAALTLGAAGPSSASPISGGAALKQAVPGGATDVRWRGGWFPGTVAAGVIGGAALAGAYPYYGYPPLRVLSWALLWPRSLLGMASPLLAATPLAPVVSHRGGG
jgi:hypothetical protein